MLIGASLIHIGAGDSHGALPLGMTDLGVLSKTDKHISEFLRNRSIAFCSKEVYYTIRVFYQQHSLSLLLDKIPARMASSATPKGVQNITKENENMKRKFLCLLLALALVMGLAAVVSATQAGEPVYSGTCGKNAVWSFDAETGTLTISGTGSTTNYAYHFESEQAPWTPLSGQLTRVVVEEGITRLGDHAFTECTNLVEVVLPDSVTELGSYVFNNCRSLAGVEFPENLTVLGSSVFSGCYALESFTIPESITEIPDSMFNYCKNLKTINFHDGVTSIGSNAFYMCESLTDVQLPAGLKTMGGGVFFNCKSLTSLDWPAALKNIYGSTFSMSGLTEFVVPEGVISIGARAFDGCSDLHTLVLPDSVDTLGEYAFSFTPNLTELRIPAAVTAIPSGCFSRSGLTEVVIPEGVTSIGRYAFHDSANLERVVLPETLTSVDSEVFWDCSSLREINWPSGVDTIGWYQFSGTALVEFTVPSTVKEVSSYAFKDCASLEKLIFEGKDTQVSGSQIFDNDSLLTIYCYYDSGAQAAAEFEAIPYILFDPPADLPRYPIYTTIFGDGTILTTPADSTGYEWITADIVPGPDSVLFDLTIYYYSDRELDLRLEMLDEDTFRFLMPKCEVEIVAAFQNTITGFIDIKSTDFCYEPVIWAVENGITNGTTEITFEPVRDVTRAEVVTFLWRANGSPLVELENPFTDVPEGSFCYDAILWAVDQGITNGTSATTFDPLKTCTRAEVVTFLYRTAGEPQVAAGSSFSDVEPGHFYADAVTWATENGITNGMGDGTFGAALICNRAQIVTFLYRAKDIEPVTRYTFELRSNDPTEEIGFVACEGTEFAAGESVIFYAEPWYGYLVEFEAEPEVELELYYLGACTYELIMPDHDVVLTANFVPAPGDPHFITTSCENGFALAFCDSDEDLNDFAKPGEFVQFYIIPDEGFTFSPEGFTATAGGQALEDWWYLGKLAEADPELGIPDGIYLVEMVMPDADVTVSITCTPGTETAAAEVRVPVSVR